MDLAVLLIVLGIAVALLVHYTLGLILLICGMLVPLVRR